MLCGFDGARLVVQMIGNIMFRSFRLGTVLGFPIRVNLTFVLLLVGVGIWMGQIGLAVALMTAGSVLLHELGHALMARHLGVPVAGIELHFFGGAAQMTELPRRPGDEIAVAAAGPAVSFALAGIGHGLAGMTGSSALALFGWVNLVLAVFNLLPAFPSDGGRILRAWLARGRGLVAATDLAVKVGRVVCLALVAAGLYFGSFQMVIVAALLWMMGSAERQHARMRGDRGDWSGRGRPLFTDVEYVPPPASTTRRPDRPVVIVVDAAGRVRLG
jgi:Zn-dependent protease